MTTEPLDPDRPPAAGPAANLIAAAVVVLLGGVAIAGANALGEGPGTWPMIVGIVLVVLGLVLAARARRDDPPERFTSGSLLVVAAVTGMIVYVAVIAVIGFEIPTAVLAFIWLRFLGRETWRTSIAVSLGTVVVFYALFVGALDVTIPHLF